MFAVLSKKNMNPEFLSLPNFLQTQLEKIATIFHIFQKQFEPQIRVNIFRLRIESSIPL